MNTNDLEKKIADLQKQLNVVLTMQNALIYLLHRKNLVKRWEVQNEAGELLEAFKTGEMKKWTDEAIKKYQEAKGN